VRCGKGCVQRHACLHLHQFIESKIQQGIIHVKKSEKPSGEVARRAPPARSFWQPLPPTWGQENKTPAFARALTVMR